MKLLLLLAQLAFSAPHPATTSSMLTDPEKGLAFRTYGFNLTTEKSNWRPIQKESDSLFAEVEFEKKDKSKSNAQITLRMDQLTKKQGIESYAKKWMRDYPHYGFEVLGTKTFAHAGGEGVVVDIVHRPNSKQLRQVILLKDKKVAILTCSDDKLKFQETLADCNQLVKSFNWL
jgi:hypothetical protein